MATKTEQDILENLLVAKEVAEKVGVKPATVYEWVRNGKIPAVVLPGGNVRFSPKDIDTWIKSNTIRQRVHAI